ncbi:helix-turn-helix transcriptional regulator [Pseudonocardia nematodicida]|uniref:helix-turn-helix transcriptional regulator n=1 Tax=Pseudonocardia nematodicida TaxID=1206997 RepID=UPI00360A5053
MRADRLLSLVLLLRRHGRMTAGAIAAELEVSERTVLRDVEALSSAGIPVYAERGRHGGFALLPGFSTDLTGLTPGEAVALLTSGSAATPGALGLGAEFSSAIRKVVGALPDRARAEATGAAERVLVRRGGWWRDPDDAEPTAVLDAVQRAVFGGTRLRMRYRTGGTDDATPSDRVVDPIGLVQASGRWYLLALRDGEDRTYRVSRIDDAEALPDPARRPEGVDLEELWLRRRADFRARRPGIRVRLRLPAELRGRLSAITLEDRAGGRVPGDEGRSGEYQVGKGSRGDASGGDGSGGKGSEGDGSGGDGPGGESLRVEGRGGESPGGEGPEVGSRAGEGSGGSGSGAASSGSGSGEDRDDLPGERATIEVTAAFGDLHHAESALWPLLPEVEVLGPAELHAALVARAESTRAALDLGPTHPPEPSAPPP